MNEHEINGNLRVEVQELTVQVAVLQSRLDGSKEALRLQANEYERRLELLNGSHQEARDVLRTYGSTYLTIDRFEREHVEWRRMVDAKLVSGSKTVWVAVGASIIALVTSVIQFLHLFYGIGR